MLEELPKPLLFSQNALARAKGVPPRRINEIVLGKRAVTADAALRAITGFLGESLLVCRPATTCACSGGCRETSWISSSRGQHEACQ
jgi:ABC-type Mn2+/Zn2+ transport system permease subunit